MIHQSYISRHLINDIKKLQNLETDPDLQRFMLWMTDVENMVYGELGMTLDDLPDELYRDSFMEGVSTGSMAKAVMRSSGF